MSFLFSSATGFAQHEIRLLEDTNVWKYDQSGQDLGTAWKEPGYNDSAWPAGSGLLGLETSVPPPYPVPINTPLSLGSPQVITYYFRSSFALPEIPPAMVALRAAAYIDDGCVLYLNGAEVGRVRVPTNQNFQTLAVNTAIYEGERGVIDLPRDSLRPGLNLLAIEVHQLGPTSSDIAWGMRLHAIVAEPIRITQSPTNRALTIGQSNYFQVEITGGPASFQWYKDGEVIPGATNQALAQSLVQTNATGAYSLTASNFFGSQTSAVARLVVYSLPLGDLTGPRMLSAVVALSGNTNNIDVTFSETFLPPTPGSIELRTADTADLVTISNITVNGRAFRLRVGGPNWQIDGGRQYIVTANGLRDRAENRIAPNSQVPVIWPQPSTVDLMGLDTEWSYHAFVLDDPSMLEGRWYRPDFVESPLWQRGLSPFYTAAAGPSTCFGAGRTQIPFQYHPLVFRTTFVASNLPPRCTLILNCLAYDGFVFFLNGQEFFRNSVAPAVEALTVDTRAESTMRFFCGDRTIPDVAVFPGTNYLVCAVYQYRDGQQPVEPRDAVFGLTLKATYLPAATLPPVVPPILISERLSPSAARLSWTGAGFALESTTNMNLGPESYPAGPWTEVRDMSNPYTNSSLDRPAQFFRLKHD